MKVTRLTRVYIVIDPDFNFAYREKWVDIANRTLEQVKRHIDYDKAYVERETETICSHCGRTWEEEPNGLPVCCGTAQSEWEEQRKLKATT